MNPSTRSVSLKKICLFLQSLVEGLFLFYLFFSQCCILWFYSFQITPLELAYLSSYILRLCLGFRLIMIFVCLMIEVAYYRTDIRIRLWCTVIRRLRHFCSEWQYHRRHFWHKLQTVDWQYKLSTYCTCNPQVYSSSQWVMTYRGLPTSLKTLGHEVFSCFFFLIIQMLVEETNRYYHQYLHALDKGQSPLPDMTVQKTCLFLAVILQMGHDQRDTLSDYWLTLE